MVVPFFKTFSGNSEGGRCFLSSQHGFESNSTDQSWALHSRTVGWEVWLFPSDGQLDLSTDSLRTAHTKQASLAFFLSLKNLLNS